MLPLLEVFFFLASEVSDERAIIEEVFMEFVRLLLIFLLQDFVGTFFKYRFQI